MRDPNNKYAFMGELVDPEDSKSSAARHSGSTPDKGTIIYAGFLLREDLPFQGNGLGLNPGSRSNWACYGNSADFCKVGRLVRI